LLVGSNRNGFSKRTYTFGVVANDDLTAFPWGDRTLWFFRNSTPTTGLYIGYKQVSIAGIFKAEYPFSVTSIFYGSIVNGGGIKFDLRGAFLCKKRYTTKKKKSD